MKTRFKSFKGFLILVLVLCPVGTALSQDKSIGDLARLSKAFGDLSRRVSPAVVRVVVTNFGELNKGAGGGQLGKSRSGGSGAIVDPAGFIITNAHVIAGATRVQVVLPISDGKDGPGRSIVKPEGKLVEAEIVASDAETDLAVLRVKETNLPYLKIGDSDKLRQGEIVFAFGSPRGLANSVSMGIVSAVARLVRENDRMIYIQTDAPINPGNSGGPLVNTKGELVGINSFIISRSGGNEGLGFAAPGNIVSNVYKQLRAYGTVRRGEIGVYAQTINNTLSQGLGLSRNWGVIVGDVFPNSPAATVGLGIGDIILTLNGKTMENGRQFNVNLYGKESGEMVTLTVLRAGKERTVQLPVVVRPDNSGRFAGLSVTEANQVPRLGIVGLDITQEMRRVLGPTRSPKGVVVAALSPNAFLYNEYLKPGDIIFSLNGVPISDLSALKATISPLFAGASVVLQIERRGAIQFLAFELQ